ncbi:MAG TPA: DJ-1/PfpI family protein [Thermoleophilaceae bacterium]|nr:DJ-1/PfpI family protein [Thermoleophilaceae bacterium]
MTARRVVIVAFEGVQPLDVVGPAEVFSTAARLQPPGYEIEIVAADTKPLRASSVSLAPDRSIASCRGPIDTLVCAGGTGVRGAARDERLLRWLRAAAKRSERVASVCTGAFLLARAGLLDGKRATTHWSACAALARSHPEIRVEPDPIFVRDGSVYTSAGVTAGMDLALALVDEDLGREVALEAARWLVLFLRRPGGQAQFAQLAAQAAEREPLRELQGWIPDNLDADLSVPALARDVSMSERNFARAFRREVGMVVPGGLGTRALLDDERMVGWIRRAHEGSRCTTSVCTGALLLGAAGILDGIEATTHWLELATLERFGARPTSRRVVEQGKVITAAGVSSGIDMALALASHLAGDQVAEAIQLAIEYDPQPPFDSGSTATARPETVALVRSVIEAVTPEPNRRA